MLLFLEIEKTGSGYKGKVHQGNPDFARPIPELKLGPDETVSIRGQEFTLGDLVKALVEYKHGDLALGFDEHGQDAIGGHLYAQILEGLPETEVNRARETREEIRIHIICRDDDHIYRLPWVLLAERGFFLYNENVNCLLSTDHKAEDHTLAPSPEMLVIAPEPKDGAYEPTGAREHLTKIEEILSAADPRLAFGRHLTLVRTWEELGEHLKKQTPDVVYYYGHGVGDIHRGRLVFDSRKSGGTKEVPIKDFADCLAKLKPSPIVAYINCCLGDAAGYLGAGHQLGRFIPAVITNRTVAKIDAAQAQAEFILETILIKGHPPHLALSLLHKGMGKLGLSTADVRWMTPVLYCRYHEWHSNPPKPIGRKIHDIHWAVKVDRVNQFSVVHSTTTSMLAEGKPKSRAFVWYGREGEGIDAFHERLNVHLGELLGDAHLHDEVRPEWPEEFENINRSFRNMFERAFRVTHFEDIPAKIRAKSQGAAGLKTLVYVRHEPVRNKKILNPSRLKKYLEWWDEHFIPMLENNQHALLGISFVVENPPKFRSILDRRERLEEIDFRNTIFTILDEMDQIARKHLLDFLRAHNVRLPVERRDRAIDNILAKTKGHYDKTIEELKDLVAQEWDLSDIEDDEIEDPPEEEDDY